MKYAKLVVVFAVIALFAVAFAPAAEANGPKGTTIADLVISNPDVTGDGVGDFSILLAAVQAASPEVFATLDGNGKHTVFAPTDAAFVKALGELGLSPGDVLGNEALVTAILKYHVASGERDASDVLDSSRIRTISKQFVYQSGGTLIDGSAATSDANIIATDIFVANGVVHVIDNVLVP